MAITYLKINGVSPSYRAGNVTVCSYCGDSIKEESAPKSNCYVFCSDDCLENWTNDNKNKSNPVYEDMILCAQCAEQIGIEDFIIYEDKHYCSENCMNDWIENDYLTRCKNGEISFLDIPREIRNKEHGLKTYKTVSNTCPTCGNIFYASSTFGEKTNIYCSEECWKVGMKPHFEKMGLLKSGWMSPNWKGGIANGKYCHKFNENLRKRVRSFFNDKCFLCGKTKEENGRHLHVHHVNYNKSACCDNSKVMFVPLCNGCHGMTNQNRDYWENYFEEILNEKYDNKCYFTKEEYNNLKSQEISS